MRDALDIGQASLVHNSTGKGPPKNCNRENLKFGLKFSVYASITTGPQIAKSGRTDAAPARPMHAAACVYNAHIESLSDTPSLPVSVAATVNFAQMQT